MPGWAEADTELQTVGGFVVGCVVMGRAGGGVCDTEKGRAVWAQAHKRSFPPPHIVPARSRLPAALPAPAAMIHCLVDVLLHANCWRRQCEPLPTAPPRRRPRGRPPTPPSCRGYRPSSRRGRRHRRGPPPGGGGGGALRRRRRRRRHGGLLPRRSVVAAAAATVGPGGDPVGTPPACPCAWRRQRRRLRRAFF